MKKRHIVLDTRIIETSTGRYMQRLLENINDHHLPSESIRYTALVPSAHVDKWRDRLPHVSVVAADQKWYSFAEQLSLPIQLWRLKPDLVHFTMPQQPILWWGRSITSILDVTLIRYDNIDGNRLVYKFKKMIFVLLLHVVMRRSRAIISPTHFVANDLATYFNISDRSRLHVTKLAGEIPDEVPEEITSLDGSQFLFYVGNAFPYKNVGRIIEAFALLKPRYPELQLALAGKKEFFYEQLEARVDTMALNDVHFLGFITDGEKRWALQHATALVTASYSEGFCMPVVEAQLEGTPVIVSAVSCLPETAGDAALYFNPDSADELADRVNDLLTTPTLAQELKEKGIKHAKSFSWQRMTDETIAIYTNCLPTTTNVER